MSSRNLLGPILMTCLLIVGFLGAAPAATAAPAGQILVSPGKAASNEAIEIRYRDRGARFLLPGGPGSIYFDYPYYYSRGYYPTHISPGATYYSQPDYDNRAYYRSSRGRCSTWQRKCAANWGPGTDDFYGCMEHHDCD
jgi:hypothetical protein